MLYVRIISLLIIGLITQNQLSYSQDVNTFLLDFSSPMTNEEFISSLYKVKGSKNNSYIKSKLSLLETDQTADKKIESLLYSVDQDITLNQSTADAYRLKGDYYIATHKWDSAIDCFEKALKIENNQNANTLIKLAIALCFGKKDYIRSVACLYDAMEIIKNNKEQYVNSEYSTSLLILSVVYNKTGNYKKSLEIARLIPDDYPDIQIYKGYIFWELRDYNNAVRCWESNINDIDPYIRIKLAYSYFMTDQYEKLKSVMSNINESDLTDCKLSLSAYYLLQHFTKKNITGKN